MVVQLATVYEQPGQNNYTINGGNTVPKKHFPPKVSKDWLRLWFFLCPSFSTFYLFSFSFYTNLFHRNQPTLKLMKLQWNETKFLEINRLKLPGGKYFINCSAKLPIIHTNGFRWICFFLQVLCKKITEESIQKYT